LGETLLDKNATTLFYPHLVWCNNNFAMKRTSNAKEKNVYVSHKLKLNVEDLRIAKMDTDFE